MTIEGVENAYSCSGAESMFNAAPANAGQASCKNGIAATAAHRLIPQSHSSMSLDTNLESWDNTMEEEENVMKYAAASNREDDDGGFIPYDYESEMEECSQYIFSSSPYCPAATAALAATATLSPVTGSCDTRPDTPHEITAVPLFLTALPPQHPACDPHSRQWCERQRRDNEAHHAGLHYVWQRAMKHSLVSSPDQMRYALRSFLREACCRELQALRSKPAVEFVRMDAPQLESRTHSAMRASCLLASASSTAQRKARYIQVITEHWKALELRVEEMLAETEKENVAMGESHLLSIGYALNALSLFGNDSAQIIRELNMSSVEEQRRQRHDREAQLLAALEAQGRLFLLPTLYAEEIEEPTPVLHVEEVLHPAGKSGEFTHPWQLLSPNASIYSLTTSSALDSIGELSPSLSCRTNSSEACTPTWRATTADSPSSPLSPWGGRTSACKGMQPLCLPMLEVFMTAPAMMPSAVIAASEAGVPHVMPVDPSYALQEMNRQEALARNTLADFLCSPKLSSADVVCSTHVLDATEDSWSSFAEKEDMCESAGTMKLSEVEHSQLNFVPRETLTGTSAAASTHAILTGG